MIDILIRSLIRERIFREVIGYIVYLY